MGEENPIFREGDTFEIEPREDTGGVLNPLSQETSESGDARSLLERGVSNPSKSEDTERVLNPLSQETSETGDARSLLERGVSNPSKSEDTERILNPLSQETSEDDGAGTLLETVKTNPFSESGRDTVVLVEEPQRGSQGETQGFTNPMDDV